MTDEELLKTVSEERKRSIGFGEGDSGELRDAQEKALLFYKGDVSKDVPSLLNRSQAVSTDVAEAVDTALPDIMEIFIGGDDVATFKPQSAEDEDRAEEDSEFVRHVIFTENPGFVTFHSAIKDALLIRMGLFHWRWEDEEKEDEQNYGPMDGPSLAVLMQAMPQAEPMEQDDGLFIAKETKKTLHGKVIVEAVPPNDFTVARDTVMLRSTTYCAMRARPRVQELIHNGIKPEIARNLKSYSHPDEQIDHARDRAGETNLNSSDATGDLRQVEIHCHYIRLNYDGKGLALWKVVTDSEETVLLDEPEKVRRVPFGSITPYLVSHRLHGESIADKLLEIQKIKTTLLRMFLDDGYFALNQRMSVDMTQANEFTIADLLRNEPNMPVRTKGPNAVAPLRAGGLNFDALAALEYTSVMGEQRSGVVRNAQGLNPESLHEKGMVAMQLIAAASKRIRFIARVIAETGVRDLVAGVHDMLRSGHGAEVEDGKERVKPSHKFTGKKDWQEVDPGSWRERNEVEVQIGIGSAGKEQDMVVMGQILEIQQGMATAGLGGIIVKPENIYNAAKRYAQSANLKTPELYFSDPKDAPPQPPKPDPEIEKAKAELELQKQKDEATLALDEQKSAAKLQSDQTAAYYQHQLNLAKIESEGELKRYQIEQEIGLKREQIDAELRLKAAQVGAELELDRELGHANADVTREVGHAKVSAASTPVRPGGEGG